MPQGCVPPYRLECMGGPYLIDAGYLQPLRSSEALCLPHPALIKCLPIIAYIKPFLGPPVVALSGPDAACLQAIYGEYVRDLFEVP